MRQWGARIGAAFTKVCAMNFVIGYNNRKVSGFYAPAWFLFCRPLLTTIRQWSGVRVEPSYIRPTLGATAGWKSHLFVSDMARGE